MRRRHQLAAAAAAVRRRQRRRAVGARHRRGADLPGVGENLQDHLEVYVQHACTQPVSVQPALKWRNRPWIGAQWLFCRRGPGATNHFEAGGFVRSNDDVAYPNLMFHFLPIAVRYDGTHAGRRARLPGARRPDVLRRPRLGEAHLDRSARASGAALQLPLDRAGPARVGGGDPRRPPHPRAARVGPASTAARSRPGPRSRPTSRSSTGCAHDAETALHPSCTCRMGMDELAVVDPATMRVHGLDGLRVVDASRVPVRHQRQHLRAGDDGRREGRRPDPRQHPAASVVGRVLPLRLARPMIALLEHPRYEVLPVDGIEEQVLAHVPREVTVTVTASPAKGLDATLAVTERLAGHGYAVVPHLSARQVRDEAHVEEIVARLASAGMRDVFVPAGDAGSRASSRTPRRCCAMDRALRRARDHRLPREPPPDRRRRRRSRRCSRRRRWRPTSSARSASTRRRSTTWIARVRARGTTLPIWVGMPGIVDNSKLVRVSMRIGLGESARFLRAHRAWLRRLLTRTFTPDPLIRRLELRRRSRACTCTPSTSSSAPSDGGRRRSSG